MAYIGLTFCPPSDSGITQRTPEKDSARYKIDVLAERNGTSDEDSEKLAAKTPVVLAARKESIFKTARQVAEAIPEAVEWVVPRWIARGSITELDAKIKGGKTTLAMAMVDACINGKPFLGVPTSKTKVVYLTEQPERSFREALRRAGLLNSEDLHCLFWHDTRHLKWPQIVGMAT